MEYRINKIDTDLRQRINEERSEDKIHTKKGIVLNKDKQNTKEEMEQKEAKEKNKAAGYYKSDNDKKTMEVVEPDKGINIDIRR